MASENETVADIANEMRIKWAQVYFSEGSRRKDGEYCDNEFAAIEPETVADRIEAAHKREVAELRECLVRRSSHLNLILQKALELRNSVPSELRKVMDECIVAEDKAIGLGVFSKKGAKDEDK